MDNGENLHKTAIGGKAMGYTQAEKDWKKANTTFVGLRIQNSSGIPAALDAFLKDNPDMTRNSLFINAAARTLKECGYDPEKFKIAKEL